MMEVLNHTTLPSGDAFLLWEVSFGILKTPFTDPQNIFNDPWLLISLRFRILLQRVSRTPLTLQGDQLEMRRWNLCANAPWRRPWVFSLRFQGTRKPFAFRSLISNERNRSLTSSNSPTGATSLGRKVRGRKAWTVALWLNRTRTQQPLAA